MAIGDCYIPCCDREDRTSRSDLTQANRQRNEWHSATSDRWTKCERRWFESFNPFIIIKKTENGKDLGKLRYCREWPDAFDRRSYRDRPTVRFASHRPDRSATIHNSNSERSPTVYVVCLCLSFEFVNRRELSLFVFSKTTNANQFIIIQTTQHNCVTATPEICTITGLSVNFVHGILALNERTKPRWTRIGKLNAYGLQFNNQWSRIVLKQKWKKIYE